MSLRLTRPAPPGTSARGLLGPSVLGTVVASLVAVAVAAVAAGGTGALGALVGGGLVLAFLLVGQLPVAQVAAGRRGLGAALLLLLYSVRIVLLLVAFRVVSGAGDDLRRTVGLTVIACALAWTAATVWSAQRWRPLVVEPGVAPDEAAGHR